jgi:hypothetical protein
MLEYGMPFTRAGQREKRRNGARETAYIIAYYGLD